MCIHTHTACAAITRPVDFPPTVHTGFTSAAFLRAGAPRLLIALVQSGWKRIPAHEELHGGTLCRPPLAVEQAQALALDLVLAELIDAVVDERGWGLFMQHRHLIKSALNVSIHGKFDIPPTSRVSVVFLPFHSTALRTSASCKRPRRHPAWTSRLPSRQIWTLGEFCWSPQGPVLMENVAVDDFYFPGFFLLPTFMSFRV